LTEKSEIAFVLADEIFTGFLLFLQLIRILISDYQENDEKRKQFRLLFVS
jgi:hypothetical protein